VTRLSAAATDDDARAAELHRTWIRRALEHLFAGFDESGAYPSTSSSPSPSSHPSSSSKEN
jgi:hypothetical protein